MQLSTSVCLAMSLLFGTAVTELQSDLLLEREHELVERFGQQVWFESLDKHFGIAWASRSPTSSSYFTALEAEIRRRMKGAPSDRQNRVAEYRLAALKNPTDTKRLFAWAFAAAVEVSIESDVGQSYWLTNEHYKELGVLRLLMDEAPPNDDTRYLRVRLLTNVAFGATRRDLFPLARRLLKLDPTDAGVERALASQLTNSYTVADFDEAQRLAKDAVARQPGRLANIGLLFDVANWKFERLGHKKEERRLAIGLARQYIASAPVGSQTRLFFERWLSSAERGKG